MYLFILLYHDARCPYSLKCICHTRVGGTIKLFGIVMQHPQQCLPNLVASLRILESAETRFVCVRTPLDV